MRKPWSVELTKSRWQWTETFESGIKKIRDDNFAFMETAITMQYYLDSINEPCSIVHMGPNLFNGKLVFAWRKNFEYAEIFNY